MQVDRTTAYGGGLVLGGGAVALGAKPIADRIYRNALGNLRAEIEAGPRMNPQEFINRIAQFDLDVGRPALFGRNIAIGLGIAAAVGGVALLGHHFLTGGD